MSPRWSVLDTQRCPQILARRIVWSGYARYKQIYLFNSGMLNNHTRTTRIVIDSHPVLTLEIGCDCYDDTSRLLAHVRSWTIGGLVLSVLSERLMMSLFVSIYLRNFGYIRCFIVLSLNPITRALSQDVLHNLHLLLSLKMDLSMRLGYSPSERTWEPIENVTNARALLEDFHRWYPDKPGPQSKTTRGTVLRWG